MTHAHHHHHHHGSGHDVPLPVADRPAGGVDELLDLQRTAGNAAVARMVELLRQDGAAGEPPPVRRSTVHDVLRRPGTPLDTGTRADMEARLGADFSGVRVHTDATAARSAEEIGARAYTSGDHVVIGRGGGDRHTLAHELTHVIQQRQGAVSGTDNGDGLRVSDPSDRFERAAEANATKALSTPAPDPRHASHDHGGDHGGGGGGEPAVQRSPATWRVSPEVNSVLNEPSTWNPLSRWPAIVDRVRAYLRLPNTDFATRGRLIAELRVAMGEWKQNQDNRTSTDRNPAQTARRRALIDALSPLLDNEDREVDHLRRQADDPSYDRPTEQAPPARASAGPSRAATAPMAIGIPGRSGAVPDDQSDDDTAYARQPARAPGLPYSRVMQRYQNVPPLPQGVQVHAHLTREQYRTGIHNDGLVRGRRQGVGLAPEGFAEETVGPPDRNNIYVLSGGGAAAFVSQDLGGDAAPIGVVSDSNVDFMQDNNYRGGGAHMYPGDAPPVRDTRPGDLGPFSFTLPATPRTRAGITDFLNRRLPANAQLTEAEAVTRVAAALFRDHPMYLAGYLD
ncbi:eCIS core domain-containing protein [Saccharothrix yanglingensis]|nr:DUF4157 domain-containing protein [Saccharothrix yanglingensis]